MQDILTTDKLAEATSARENLRVEPQLYTQAFGTDFGQRVIDDLVQRYYAQPSYKKGDPYHTAFQEGQREVLRFMLSQMYLGENPPQQLSE